MGIEVLGPWWIQRLRPAAKWGRSRWLCPGVGILGHLAAGSVYLTAMEALLAESCAGSNCMRIHAGTSGTFLREVGCSLSGHDQVLMPGKKRYGKYGIMGRLHIGTMTIF